jgi:hypothetical protein
LRCWCRKRRQFDCPESPEAAFNQLRDGTCPDDVVHMNQGCGLTRVVLDGGYAFNEWVFEDATGELVSAAVASALQFGPCDAFSYALNFPHDECAEETECRACPAEGSEAVRCDFASDSR